MANLLRNFKSKLTSHQIEYFMVQRLKSAEWKSEQTKNDRYKFLTQIYQKYITKIPYQNLTRVARPKFEFNAPTKGEIIKDVISGVGGGCTTLSYFFCELLKGLGYNAFTVRGNNNGNEISNTHLTTIVNLSEQELYYCGFGIMPLYHPIRITPGIKYIRMEVDNIGYEYKETKIDGVFELSNVNGSYFGRLFPERERKFTNNLIPEEYKENNEYTKYCYVNPNCTLLRIPILFRYLVLNNDHEMYVIIAGSSMVTYDNLNSNEPRKATKFADATECKNVIRTYFPMLSAQLVEEALEYFKNINLHKKVNVK